MVLVRIVLVREEETFQGILKHILFEKSCKVYSCCSDDFPAIFAFQVHWDVAESHESNLQMTHLCCSELGNRAKKGCKCAGW